MYWDLDTVRGLAVYTDTGRTFYPDTRVLGIRDGELLLTQDVTGSSDFDYEDAPLSPWSVGDGDAVFLPLAPYKVHRVPVADVVRLEVDTVDTDDEDSLTALALEASALP